MLKTKYRTYRHRFQRVDNLCYNALKHEVLINVYNSIDIIRRIIFLKIA